MFLLSAIPLKGFIYFLIKDIVPLKAGERASFLRII